jgi:hypothetical protein
MKTSEQNDKLIEDFLLETNYTRMKVWSVKEQKQTTSAISIGIHIASVFNIDVVKWAGNKRYDEEGCYESVIKFIKSRNKNK